MNRIIFVQNMSDLFAEAVPDELILDVLHDLDRGTMGALNKTTGNMFEFVTHTYNPIGGTCPFKCGYCYVAPQLRKPELANKYSGDPVKIVGRMTSKGTNNRFLFLTKDPARYIRLKEHLQKPNYVLGTTLESDEPYADTKAPTPTNRFTWMVPALKQFHGGFISIEPIMAFTPMFLDWLTGLRPTFVAIGANTTANVQLPEPSAMDVLDLIKHLRMHVSPLLMDDMDFKPNYRAEMTGHPTIYLKDNLRRLIPDDFDRLKQELEDE